jgi:glutamine amidotransferase
MPLSTAKVAIIDYNMGNLFNVKRACTHVGMQADITSLYREIIEADAVILPGVGAFGDAMKSLKDLDLINPLKDIAASGKPLIGICLGMHLLMTESDEFGKHFGMDIIKGSVVGFRDAVNSPASGTLKVPQVGWNRVFSSSDSLLSTNNTGFSPDSWSGSPLDGIPEGEYMYFVHSFFVKPEDNGVVMSISRYGDIEFCSSLRYKNISAFQFHPERSGFRGLHIYKNIASLIKKEIEENKNEC